MLYALPKLAYALQCAFTSHVPRQRSQYFIVLERAEIYSHSRVVVKQNATVRLSELPIRAVISRS
jgi:hypothetical protein